MCQIAGPRGELINLNVGQLKVHGQRRRGKENARQSGLDKKVGDTEDTDDGHR